MSRLACSALLLAVMVTQAQAISWRLFAGREECITEIMPDYQWEMVKNKEQTPEHTHVLVDLGFVITSRYGTEANKAAVDFNVYGPTGNSVHKEDAVSETEIAGKGQRGGPWHRMSCPTLPPACGSTAEIMLLPLQLLLREGRAHGGRVSVSARDRLVLCVHPAHAGIACCCLQILRPSVIVKISYFTVNSMSMVGTNFEWQRNSAAGGETPEAVDPKHLGTIEQVEEVTQGLQRLDYYLMNVTNEQRYLYARTVRHLRTAESTYSRTFGYMILICSTIVLASFAQVMGVRMMFKNNRRGLII
ncbi:hypothetical protein ACK3TF_004907 [Chlorella vulgaris]